MTKSPRPPDAAGNEWEAGFGFGWVAGRPADGDGLALRGAGPARRGLASVRLGAGKIPYVIGVS